MRFWLVAAAATTLNLAQRLEDLEPPHFNPDCTWKCAPRLARCLIDPTCHRFDSCMRTCWYSDSTSVPQDTAGPKKTFSMCMFECAAKYGSQTIRNIGNCLSHNQCLRASRPQSCPRPCLDTDDYYEIDSDGDVTSWGPPGEGKRVWREVDGEWWVLRGLGDTIDRWPGVTVTFETINIDSLRARILVRVPIEDDAVGRLVSTIVFQSELADSNDQDWPEWQFELDSGLKGKKVFYILTKTPEYVLVYYCGDAGIGTDLQGGWLLGKQRGPIPHDVLRFFRWTLKQTYLSIRLSDYQRILS